MRTAPFVSILVATVAPASLLTASAMAAPHCAHKLSAKPSPEVAKLTDKAREAASAGRFEEAIAGYKQAWCLQPDPIFKRSLSAAELSLGRCDDAMKDGRFLIDHASDADREPSLKWMDELVGQCAEVTIQSAPAGAVFIDAAPQKSGTTPWKGLLKSGRHMIVVRAKGFEDGQQNVDIPVGIAAPLDVQLTLLPPKGAPPQAVAAVPPPPAPPVSATPAGTEATHAEPPRPPAALKEVSVTTDPPGASVFIDSGQAPAGTTPWHGKVEAGNHLVEVRRAGFVEGTTRIRVPTDATDPVSVNLKLRAADP